MYISQLLAMIRQDIRLRILLSVALVVQVIFCLSAIGSYHPDQYFQIIEFSSWQLHRPSAAPVVWEFAAHLRSTLQVYLFSAYYEVCAGLGITDPYSQLEVLRLLFGLALFAFFNILALSYFRDERRNILYWVLFILNFSWILPYTRTLYSSEMLSSLLFFGALALYEWRSRGEGPSRRLALLTGFLFCLAFYARFQTGFAIAGFAGWMILSGRQRKGLVWLGIGFLAGVLIDTALDSVFYHHLVCTPYIYFRVNIIEGKAASMGTSSFLVYVAVLLAVILAPPLSIFLLGAGFRTALMKKLNRPMVASVLVFILGHCLVAHKEERFLFPVLNVLPIFVGWGLPGLLDWYRRCRKGLRGLLRGMAFFSLGLNLLLLVILSFTPYSQSIYFTWRLKREFANRQVTIYSLDRTPFQTEEKLPFVFYQNSVPNLHWQLVHGEDSLADLGDQAVYLSATFNQIKDRPGLLDSLGYEKEIYSSRLLWGVNQFIGSLKMNTINDIWVLYKKR
jgi:phosphatidylinositol glycan class B